MKGALAARLADGRLHLQHGPIDVIVELFATPEEVELGYRQAAARFRSILDGLVAELGVLRKPLGETYPFLRDPIGRTMVQVAWPHRRVFVTPMAAVAGAVADAVLAAAVAGRRIERGYANNGGDIALCLAPGQSFTTGIVDRVDMPALDASIAVNAADGIGGMATSGWRGRSLSRGIADAVTVLAADAASADVAATLIANAVNVEHPAIRRVPAHELDPDSDLGERLVTVEVADLPDEVVEAALAAGLQKARQMQSEELIVAAYLSLQERKAVLQARGRSDSHSVPLPQAEGGRSEGLNISRSDNAL